MCAVQHGTKEKGAVAARSSPCAMHIDNTRCSISHPDKNARKGRQEPAF